jgi:ATP-dependent Clp protease ATP-binding subunit ClpC
MRDSRELARVIAEARAIADEANQPPSTAHLLLALFATPNPADLVLRSKRLDEDALLAKVKEVPRDADDAFAQLLDRAREIARGTGGREAKALHLLLAIARAKGLAAHELLALAGAPTAEIAREVLSYVVGPLPRRFLPKDAPDDDDARTPVPAHVAVATVAAEPARGRSTVPPPRSRTSIPPTRPARHSGVDAPTTDPQRTSRLTALKRIAEGLDAEAPAEPFALSPEEFPYLASLGRNLSELAAAGRIDPVLGRDREIDETLDVLGKRRSNNPVLVGEPGVGKTAVVEGVARRLAEQHGEEGGSPPKLLVELDVAGIISGTQLRGSLSEKLNGIKDEVRRAGGRIVVFIDEIHSLVGAGSTGEGAQDAANELKAALARGEFPCIGATTFAEFQRYFAQDPALERRFVPIRVDEPTVPEAIEILRGVVTRYAEHHKLAYEDDALVAAAQLTTRYVRDRCLPDKALTALDQAGSRARREGLLKVTRAEVARAVARMARIPEERVLSNDAERILELEKELAGRVIGHAAVVERVARAVRRNFAGFSGQRPLASFIFLGPTGVGKTELARSLADVVFGDPGALVRVDMSEMSESHSVARLVGAPPGYVGFGEGGQLTDAVRRRPASVVLFDEIEKGHRDAQQLLLQVLDEGHLTDARGRRVDFTSTIVVLTSNLGAEAFAARRERAVGFGSAEASDDREAKATAMAREAFPPELWNRIEERLVFKPLRREDLRRIAHLLAAKSSTRLLEDKGIRFELDDGAVDWLLDNGGQDPELGARPMRQVLARLVEAPMAEKILRGEIQHGDRVRVMVRGGKLAFEQLTIIEPRLARTAES